MLLKRVLKHKTSFICYFELHDLYLFTFLRLKSLPCPRFAGQLAHACPLKCYNDDYQCCDYQCCDYQCYPRFTLISAFYLSSAFYSHIRVLPSRPSVRPYPRFTLTLQQPHINMQQLHINMQQLHINMQQLCINMQQLHINMQQLCINMQQ